MNEENQLRAFLLFIFTFAVLTLSQVATASVVVSPSIPGYNRSSGMFKAPSASFAMTAANDGYIKQTVINVSGKPVTIPAKMRLAANAGNFAKNAIRLNPYLLTGTLALSYLADQAMEWDENTQSWVMPSSEQMYGTAGNLKPVFPHTEATKFCTCGRPQEVFPCAAFSGSAGEGYADAIGCSSCGSLSGMVYSFTGGYTFTTCPTGVYTSPPRPATDQDWNNLPSPLPALAPELPYAPYLPEGIPVEAPTFDTMTVPLGNPYERLDGSTAQPMAKIQDAGQGDLRVDTYDQPLTDPLGNPLAPGAAPEPTTQQPPDPCTTNPDRAGCVPLGDSPPMETIPEVDLVDAVSVQSLGSGICPADISLPLGMSWSFTPICTFADNIRPLVIGFAWLSFGLIVAGGVRQ